MKKNSQMTNRAPKKTVPFLIIISMIISASVLFPKERKNYIYRTKDGKLLLTNQPQSKDYASLVRVFEARKDYFYSSYGDYYRGKYSRLVKKYSSLNGISPKLVDAVIQVESGYDYTAVSPSGAKGLMQLMDSTAEEVGVTNVFDPEQNIRGGTEYLSKMIDRYNGNLTYALAAYNAGPTRVDQYKGVPPFRETKRYIKKIKRVLEGYGITAVKDIPVKRKKSPTKLTWKRENGKVVITSVR